MRHLRSIVDRLGSRRAVVVGDVILDEYLHGDVSRLSPEAPVPVLELRATEHRLGGAANAAANMQALGCDTTLIGVVGSDAAAIAVSERLHAAKIVNELVVDPSRPTSRKTRIVAQQQQIVRIDQERRQAIDGDVQYSVRRAMDRAIPLAQVCVISDYGKGVVTAGIARHAIRVACASGIPIIVDPKQRDFSLYAGATVLTPNLRELEAAAPGLSIDGAAAKLLPSLDGAALLVTRSAEGMSLYRRGHGVIHQPSCAREVFDVTGAGDTVVAAVALALAARQSFEIAMEIASLAAAIAVSRTGTATVSLDDLRVLIDQGADDADRLAKR